MRLVRSGAVRAVLGSGSHRADGHRPALQRLSCRVRCQIVQIVFSRPPSAGFSRAPGTKVAPVLAVLVLAFFDGGAVAQELTSRHSNTLAGSSLFGSKGCADCHSIEGLGFGGVFRREPTADGLSFFRLATRMWNHVPAMAVAGQEPDQMLHRLDSRDVANLVAFLFAARYGDAPADTASGHALYIEKQCVRCHQHPP